MGSAFALPESILVEDCSLSLESMLLLVLWARIVGHEAGRAEDGGSWKRNRLGQPIQ